MSRGKPSAKLQITCSPATAERWKDIESLFGPRGACAGCWCMWWRLPTAEFRASVGEKNKAGMRKLVKSGGIPGVLAYVAGHPIGWCAIAPRNEYPRLAKSRILKPVDDRPVWSITCFFVARHFRRQRVTEALLQAAVDYARSQGAKVVEGYPHDLGIALPDAFVYTGLLPTFLHADFRVVARRSRKRPIVHLECQ